MNAIDQTRACIPMRAVLRLLRLSPSRFHAWRRRHMVCALDDQSSCPRTSPHRLTPSEIRVINDMVTAADYRHVPTGTLAILSQRLGKVWAAPSPHASSSSSGEEPRTNSDQPSARPLNRIKPGLGRSRPTRSASASCVRPLNVLRLLKGDFVGQLTVQSSAFNAPSATSPQRSASRRDQWTMALNAGSEVASSGMPEVRQTGLFGAQRSARICPHLPVLWLGVLQQGACLTVFK
jgi:hypothetical protein